MKTKELLELKEKLEDIGKNIERKEGALFQLKENIKKEGFTTEEEINEEIERLNKEIEEYEEESKELVNELQESME